MEEETEVSSQIGRVLDQFPTPGCQQVPGTEVTIVVGKRAIGAFREEEEGKKDWKGWNRYVTGTRRSATCWL